MRPFRPTAIGPTFRSLRPISTPTSSPSPLVRQRCYRDPWQLPHRRLLSQSIVKVSKDRTTRYRRWIYYAIAANLMTWIVFRNFVKVEIEVEEVEVDPEEAGDEEEVELPEYLTLEDSEYGTFLPYWIPTKLPERYFKSSDPEWQEFSKFSRDKEKQAAVKKQLAEIITSKIAQMDPQMMRKKVGWTRYWFDFDYPDAHSPEYTRPGMFVSDEYGMILKIDQRIPHSEYVRIAHLLSVKPYLRAVRDTAKLIYHLQSGRIKQYVGLAPNQDQRKAQMLYKQWQKRASLLLLKLDKEEQAEVARRAQQEKNAKDFGGGGALQSFASSSAENKTASSSSNGSERRSWSLANLNFSLPVAMPNVSVPLSSILALGFFRHALKLYKSESRWNRHPSGCLFVRGDLEVMDTKVRKKFSVFAAYHPTEEQWYFLRADVRHVRQLQQKAKGGN